MRVSLTLALRLVCQQSGRESEAQHRAGSKASQVSCSKCHKVISGISCTVAIMLGSEHSAHGGTTAFMRPLAHYSITEARCTWRNRLEIRAYACYLQRSQRYLKRGWPRSPGPPSQRRTSPPAPAG